MPSHHWFLIFLKRESEEEGKSLAKLTRVLTERVASDPVIFYPLNYMKFLMVGSLFLPLVTKRLTFLSFIRIQAGYIFADTTNMKDWLQMC